MGAARRPIRSEVQEPVGNEASPIEGGAARPAGIRNDLDLARFLN